MTQDILNLGAVAVIFLFAVKEFFGYLKSRNDHSNGNKVDVLIFKELQTMNDNHLHTIQGVIESGNRDIVRAINDGNRQIIQLLGEIKGGLNNK